MCSCRFCRKLKKCCSQCWSIKFWKGNLHDKVRSVFGKFVHQSIILLYIVGDIFASISLILYYVYVPEVAKLSLIPFIVNYKGYVLAAMCRIGVFLLGAWACCGRRVRSMRVYFFFMPFAIFCSLIVASPLVRHTCDCSTFKQCSVAVAYKRDQVTNTVPHIPKYSQNQDIFMDPPQPTHRDKASDRRLDSLHADHEDKNIVYHSPNGNEISQTDLLKSSCTCAGALSNTGVSGRKSCRFYKEGGSEDHIKAWCHVREESKSQCVSANLELYEDDSGSSFSKEFCSDSHPGVGCECSHIGMIWKPSGKFEDVREDLLSDKMSLGSRCELWTRSDEKNWCFVGFDTICSDRQEYTLTKQDIENTGVTIDKIQHVSQFWSSIPCYKEALLTSKKWCRFWRNIFRVVTGLLVFGPWPMGVVIYLWLLNRCGDLFILKEQFKVEFSSSDDSDDDFTVRDSDVDPRKMKKAARKSKMSESGSSNDPGSFGRFQQFGDASHHEPVRSSGRRQEPGHVEMAQVRK